MDPFSNSTTIDTKTVLSVHQLVRHYRIPQGFGKKAKVIKALNGVSFELKAGQTLAIVGESGCGKSTLAKQLTMIEKPSSGELMINGKGVTQLSSTELKQLRTEIQMVFQNPYASLNPRKTIGFQLAEPLTIHTKLTTAEKEEKVKDMMQKVGLRPEHMGRYPHMFSGGQRQRIALARAMMLQPHIVVADEPTSALDVSIQAQVLNLFMDLQEQFQTAYVFISHNLSVVRHVADDVMVMYLGKAVEHGPKDVVFEKPLHPYTRALMAAAPSFEPKENPLTLTGDLPSPLNPPTGCALHERCPYAKEVCKNTEPELRMFDRRLIACHLVEEMG